MELTVAEKGIPYRTRSMQVLSPARACVVAELKKEKIMTLLKVQKGGKGPSFRKGNATNHGKVVHVVPPAAESGFWSTSALCGAKPGYAGLGWLHSGGDVTCKKCLKKLV